MNKTNEQVQAGVVRHWERKARQHNMTVDEYHAYRKAQAEQRRREWGLSMANAITVDDAQSLLEYAEKLAEEAKTVLDFTTLRGMSNERKMFEFSQIHWYLGEKICALHDRLRLVTAVLDRIDENRH